MSVYSLSDLNTETGERIIKKMRLTEDVLDIKEPLDTSIAGYPWIARVAYDEGSQRAGYLVYLHQHLKKLMDRGDFLLDDIADDKSVLSIVDPRLPFRLNGTADVLLINRRTKNPLIKSVKPSHVPQALGQLVSCSMKALSIVIR